MRFKCPLLITQALGSIEDDVDDGYREFMLSNLAKTSGDAVYDSLSPDHPPASPFRSQYLLHNKADTGSLAPEPQGETRSVDGLPTSPSYDNSWLQDGLAQGDQDDKPEKPLFFRRFTSRVGNCKPIPSSLFKKSEIIDVLPSKGAKWSTVLERMKQLWNGNVLSKARIVEIPEASGGAGRDGPVKLLASGMFGSVWLVGGKVQKFKTNCLAVVLNRDCPEPCTTIANEETLLTEFLVSDIVCRHEPEICPVVSSISGTAEVDKDVFTGLELTMEKEVSDYCIRGKSTYRRIEEQVVGPGVATIFNGVSSPVERAILAVQVLIKTIDLLQKLHARGFIHGDIHFQNIALKDPQGQVVSGKVPALTLIDFEMAKFYPIEEGTDECAGQDEYAGLSWTVLSKFQIEGYRTSRRDDVYRAFEVFLYLITDGEYWDLMGLEGMYAEDVKVNFAVDIFEPSEDYWSNWTPKLLPRILYKGMKPLKGDLSANVYFEVVDRWRFIHRYVAKGIKIDEEPNYALIMFTMSTSLEILDEHRKSDSPSVGGAGRRLAASMSA